MNDLTDTEKLAALEKWLEQFRDRCTRDVNHWGRYQEKMLEIKALGMLQTVELILNKIEELSPEKEKAD